jgi:hypothetical protein
MLVKESIRPKGFFHVEQWRDGKLIHKEVAPNGVTNEGKDKILDAYFRNQTQPTQWYLGFIDNAGFSALADTDTMSSHAGWAEATGYSEATRPAWTTTAAASQSITNPTPATFNITGVATLKGIFVPSDNTKSGTTGDLWATALFAGNIPVDNGDIIKITYTVNAT